ncbi:hypothetical protein FYK55_00860 [Roseiconus nitratireducens]|uniref:Uncharacterized protein n=1 Tax=Roseiconus nitratireducens TaxID=2605748 RepID=A0A5M6DLJ2_9BACT|nr:hypothetical protein [Roseiconus nitratireducens]KAA5547000.1 hypothetical protein FYK55_00860 [Roseiconus nitratireducens]
MGIPQCVMSLAFAIGASLSCLAADVQNANEPQKLRFEVQPDDGGILLLPASVGVGASDVTGLFVTCERVQFRGSQAVFVNASCASDGNSFITGTRLTISAKSPTSLSVNVSDDARIEFTSAKAKKEFLRTQK